MPGLPEEYNAAVNATVSTTYYNTVQVSDNEL